MRTIIPTETPLAELHQYLLGSVGPRPIAFASTMDEEGRPNLSPFSFFNVFGINPATLVFSPSRRGKDKSTKHTLDNIKVNPEVVINVVTWDIVQQASLSSTEYEQGVNEFIKSGLTMQPSQKVKPFRVKESPVQFECRVREVFETGQGGGAGNLVICEILLIHMSQDIFDDNNLIDPQKLKLVGRMGRDFYSKAFGDAVFEVQKPLSTKGIGVDALPEKIRLSQYLTGNELGMLGNLEQLPGEEELNNTRQETAVIEILEGPDKDHQLALKAKKLLKEGDVVGALKVLLA